MECANLLPGQGRCVMHTLSKTAVSKFKRHSLSASVRDSSMNICSGKIVYSVETRKGRIIASYQSIREAKKFLLTIAHGCNLIIKRTEHRRTIPGQSAAATRLAMAFNEPPLDMLKPSDFEF